MKKPGQVAARWDPTRTSPIVNAWVRDFTQRLKKLKADIVEHVAKEDEWALNNYMKHNKRKYEFATSAEKLQTFRDWVNYRIKFHLMDMQEGPAVMQHEGQWWANKYVLSAYKKGMIRAGQEMKQRGFKQYQQLIPVELKQPIEQWAAAALLAPIHMDRVALIYSRTYDDLKGITDAAAKTITDKLADSMVNGSNPYDTAKEMTDALDMAATRARMIARTETIRAHHVGSVNTYREAGIEGVEVQAELATVARGSENHDALHVCDECRALEAETKENPMSLDEIEGLIPVHPNCLLSPRSPITTKRGIIPISQVRVGDRVMTHTGRFCRVTQVHQTVVRSPLVAKLSFEKGNYIKVTAEHPVWASGVWRKALEVTVGMTMYRGSVYKKSFADFHAVTVTDVQWYNHKRATRLYNLSVDKDESYLVKGMVVHNCRCVAIPRVMSVDYSKG